MQNCVKQDFSYSNRANIHGYCSVANQFCNIFFTHRKRNLTWESNKKLIKKLYFIEMQYKIGNLKQMFLKSGYVKQKKIDFYAKIYMNFCTS